MLLTKALVGLVAIIGAVDARYKLVDTYDPSNFEKGFEVEAITDPTFGFVDYVDSATAQKQGLLGRRQGEIYIGVDHKETVPNGAKGRKSVRVRSKKVYTKGLFVFDVTHMPVGCTVWPAIWTFGGPENGDGINWPNKGEIDIIEGVHNSDHNSISLHTSPGCKAINKGSSNENTPGDGNAPFAAKNDCSAPNGKGNDGCKQVTKEKEGYGAGFNRVKGGVYIMEWTDEHIAVWRFPRNRLPKLKSPDPSKFGTPMAKFTGCEFKKYFKQHRIIINTTLCGAWAGEPSVWAQQGECAAKHKECKAFVASSPKEFSEAFWQIRDIKVFSAA